MWRAAAPGSGISVVKTLHRIDEDTLKKEVEVAGEGLAPDAIVDGKIDRTRRSLPRERRDENDDEPTSHPGQANGRSGKWRRFRRLQIVASRRPQSRP